MASKQSIPTSPGFAPRVKPAGTQEPKRPLGTKFIYLMWFVVLCDPQWLVARYTTPAVRQIATVLFVILLVMVVIRRPKNWFPPLAAFLLYTVAVVPFAYNRGQTFAVVKALTIFYVLAIGTMAYIRGARHALPIVSGFMLWQYIWWIGLGASKGRVLWHPLLANFDAFGPLMDMGIGATFFYALATNNKKERYLAFLTCVACVVGLVSSFARGAVLAGCVVLFWIWFRSNRKGISTVAIAISLVAVVVAGSFISGGRRSETNSSFFYEMSTIGSGDGTQSDRSVLWALARRVWKENPIVGVGAMNFGPYAAENFTVGTTGGAYNNNPLTLWGRQLHSTYFQILCEYGTIGSAIFLWMLIDFFRKCADLRKPKFRERWQALSGGRLELGQLSRGIETAMVGFLASALFYNQIFDIHWLYTLLTMCGVLHIISRPMIRRPVLRSQARFPAPSPQ